MSKIIILYWQNSLKCTVYISCDQIKNLIDQIRARVTRVTKENTGVNIIGELQERVGKIQNFTDISAFLQYLRGTFKTEYAKLEKSWKGIGIDNPGKIPE